MTESAYLGGKVLKRSLPVFSGNPGPDAPALKRLMLPQGELAHFFDGEEPVRFMACVELREGCVRGNHYHRKKREWVYVIQGGLSLLLGEIEGDARDSLPMTAGDLVVIPTGVAHALKTVVQGQAIEFSSSRFDPADTFRFALV